MVSRNALQSLSERARVIWDQMEAAKSGEGVENPLQTEEAAKNALVMPFMMALGYDVFNPSEVVPEFTADFGTRHGEKVDYAIIHDGQPAIIFECKKADDPLHPDRVSQLSRYFNSTPARIGILTGGIVYKVFSDLETENLMDREPFLEIDIRNLKDRDFAELGRLSKDQFDLANVRSAGVNMRYSSGMRAYLNELYQQPDEAFVTMMARRVLTPGVILTAQRREALVPLVRNAFRSFVADRINETLAQAVVRQDTIDSGSLSDNETTPTDETGGQEPGRAGAKIITTVEEQEGYELVQSLVSGVVAPERVTINDTQNYCGITIDGNSRKTICLLVFNSRTKTLRFGGRPGAEHYRLDTVADIANYADRLQEAARQLL